MSKSLKKFLAGTLAIALSISSFTISFAAENEKEARVLYDLGLFKGTSSDSYVPNLEGTTNREQAMVMLASIFDWDLPIQTTSSFPDVSTWAVPYTEYAKVNGITAGIGGGLFGASNDVTKAQVLSWITSELGYGPSYNNPMIAASAGLISEEEAIQLLLAVSEGNEEALIRDDLVGIFYDTLTVKNDNTRQTVIQDLVEKGVVDEEDAIDAGLMEEEEEEVTELEVVEITVDSLAMLTVEFNQALDLDSAENIDNYQILDEDDDEIEINAIQLLDDDKSVAIYFDPIGQQESIVLEISDIMDKTKELTLDDMDEALEIIDKTIPSVEDVEVIGSHTIKVVFSEPMDPDTIDEDNFEVDDGDYRIDEILSVNNHTELNIILRSELDEGEIEILIDTGIEDYAGYSIVRKTISIDVEEDDEEPEVIAYKGATPTEVTLIFNEAVKIADDDVDNFYHTNSRNTVDVAKDSSGRSTEYAEIDLSDDGKELTLYFSDNHLADGVTYVYVLEGAVEDLWGNENDQIMVKVEIEEDEEEPEVVEVDVKSDTEIIVTFSEVLDEDSAEEEDNYVLLDDEDEEVERMIDKVTYSNKKVTIEFEETLDGTYIIEYDDIEDLSGNKAKGDFEFTISDLTPPDFEDFKATLYYAGQEDQMIIIEFGESMDVESKYSIDDEEKYRIDGIPLTELIDDYDAELILGSQDKSVEIYIPCEDDGGIDLESSTSGDKVYITISRVADADGNYTVDYVYDVELVDQENIGFEKVEAIDIDTVEVTFNTRLKEFEEDDVVITTSRLGTSGAEDEALEIARVRTSLDDAGQTVMTLTLDEDNLLDYDANYDGDTVYAYVVDDESETSYGETLAVGDYEKVADKIKPRLKEDDDDEDDADIGDYLEINEDSSFTLLFDEDLMTPNNNTILMGNDFAIWADGDLLVNGIDYVADFRASAVKDEVKISLINDYLGFDGEIEIELVSNPKYLTDLSGNVLTDFSIDEFDVVMAPGMVRAEAINNNTLIVEFSEEVTTKGDADSDDIAEQFSIDGVEAIDAVIDGDEMTLIFPAKTFSEGEKVYDDLVYDSSGGRASIVDIDTTEDEDDDIVYYELQGDLDSENIYVSDDF